MLNTIFKKNFAKKINYNKSYCNYKMRYNQLNQRNNKIMAKILRKYINSNRYYFYDFKEKRQDKFKTMLQRSIKKL